MLGSRPVLEKAMTASSLILHRYVLHLVALSVAQLVPGQLPANQGDRLTGERMEMAATCPFPAKLTVSSQLVENIIIQLMLKLHPLYDSDTKEHSQQDLLTMCLHVSTVRKKILHMHWINFEWLPYINENNSIQLTDSTWLSLNTISKLPVKPNLSKSYV